MGINSDMLFNWVYGQLPPEKNCPPFRVGFSVRVRVSFRVAGATRQLPRRKIDLWLGLGVGLRLVLGLMGEGGQFSSGAIVLEPFNRNESLLNLSYEGIVGIYFEKFRKKKSQLSALQKLLI